MFIVQSEPSVPLYYCQTCDSAAGTADSCAGSGDGGVCI